MIIGYKCFNKELTNRYGMQFEEGNTYHVSGDIKFGNNGNGFHLCKNLEDCFRYFDAMNEEVDVCRVMGYGKMVSREDDYYGYYDMYSVEYIKICKKLSREEIISIIINSNNIFSVIRFVSLFKLTEEEKEMFKELYKLEPLVLNNIAYYQEHDKNAFKRTLK